MIARFKYVIVPQHGMDWPILFPEAVTHSQAVNKQQVKPVSAGFCEIHGDDVTVEGWSDSLGLTSRPKDAVIIKDALLLSAVMAERTARGDSRPTNGTAREDSRPTGGGAK